MTPQRFLVRFDVALNSGDLDRLLSLYEPEATFHATGRSIQQSLEALRKKLQGLIAVKAQLHNKLRHLLQCGETALIIVDWTLVLDLPDAGRVERQGTATNVIRRSAEHGWRMLIANPQGAAQGGIALRVDAEATTLNIVHPARANPRSSSSTPGRFCKDLVTSDTDTGFITAASPPNSVGGAVPMLQPNRCGSWCNPDKMALVARVGVGRYVLLGHSMGGKVAMLRRLEDGRVCNVRSGRARLTDPRNLSEGGTAGKLSLIGLP